MPSCSCGERFCAASFSLFRGSHCGARFWSLVTQGEIRSAGSGPNECTFGAGRRWGALGKARVNPLADFDRRSNNAQHRTDHLPGCGERFWLLARRDAGRIPWRALTETIDRWGANDRNAQQVQAARPRGSGQSSSQPTTPAAKRSAAAIRQD
jgi:hypothetical protein